MGCYSVSCRGQCAHRHTFGSTPQRTSNENQQMLVLSKEMNRFVPPCLRLFYRNYALPVCRFTMVDFRGST